MHWALGVVQPMNQLKIIHRHATASKKSTDTTVTITEQVDIDHQEQELVNIQQVPNS